MVSPATQRRTHRKAVAGPGRDEGGGGLENAQFAVIYAEVIVMYIVHDPALPGKHLLPALLPNSSDQTANFRIFRSDMATATEPQPRESRGRRRGEYLNERVAQWIESLGEVGHEISH